MPKSLLDRNDEEGFISSYAPNIVRNIKISVSGYDQAVNLCVDMQDENPSNAKAEIQIGLSRIDLRGSFLLESPEKIQDFLLSNDWYSLKIKEAVQEWNWVQNSPKLHKDWVTDNLPVKMGDIEISGEVCNEREIRIFVKNSNGNFIASVGSIYSLEDAELCLNAFKEGKEVRILTDYESSHVSKKDLVDFSKSQKVAWVFQSGKPRTKGFVKRFL